MAYKMIFDRILVKRDPLDNNTTGVLLPHDVQKPARTGVVISAGNTVQVIKVGDKVAFSEYAGNFLKTNTDLEEPDLIVIREDEVLSIIEAD